MRQRWEPHSASLGRHWALLGSTRMLSQQQQSSSFVAPPAISTMLDRKIVIAGALMFAAGLLMFAAGVVMFITRVSIFVSSPPARVCQDQRPVCNASQLSSEDKLEQKWCQEMTDLVCTSCTPRKLPYKVDDLINAKCPEDTANNASYCELQGKFTIPSTISVPTCLSNMSYYMDNDNDPLYICCPENITKNEYVIKIKGTRMVYKVDVEVHTSCKWEPKYSDLGHDKCSRSSLSETGTP